MDCKWKPTTSWKWNVSRLLLPNICKWKKSAAKMNRVKERDLKLKQKEKADILHEINTTISLKNNQLSGWVLDLFHIVWSYSIPSLSLWSKSQTWTPLKMGWRASMSHWQSLDFDLKIKKSAWRKYYNGELKRCCKSLRKNSIHSPTRYLTWQISWNFLKWTFKKNGAWRLLCTWAGKHQNSMTACCETAVSSRTRSAVIPEHHRTLS